ncbi:MAG: hypothetical protein J6Q51_00865 [Clostridia bacterium]|nr:hypothetical protein [Clostridia bacterium]
MKKTKIIVSVFTFCVAILALCFGVYAAISVNYKASGTVNYTVSNAKVEVTTTLYKAKAGFNSAYALKAEADTYATKTTSGWTKVGDANTFNTTTGEYVAGTSDKVTGLAVDYVEQTWESYYVVIGIKNLDTMNAFARITSEKLEDGINSHVYASAGDATIAQNETATIVIAFALDDPNTPITAVDFEYEIEIGAGVMPTNLVDKGTYWGVEMGTTSTNEAIVWKLVSIDNGVSPYTYSAEVPAGLGVFVLESTNANLTAQNSIDAAHTYMNGAMVTALNISTTMQAKLATKKVNQDTFKVDGNDISYTKGAAMEGKFYLLSELEALNLLGDVRPADAYGYNNATRTGLAWNSAAYLLRTTNKTVAADGAAAGAAAGATAVRPAFTLAV